MVQEAIESCFAGNDEIDVEVVVVDDGSTDGTREYLDNIDNECVRPILQEHQGAQVARNKGQQAARGRAVKHLDDDDYLIPGGLEQEYHRLREANADVCFSLFYKHNVTNGDRWLRNSNYENKHEDFFVALASQSISRLQLALLFDESAISNVSWDESLPYLQDVDYMLRVASKGLRCVKLEHPVAVHRIHDEDRISDVRNSADTVENLLKKCEWYDQTFRRLKNRMKITPVRRKAAAIGMWREAHKMAPYEWHTAQPWLRRASELAPGFQPDRSNLFLSVLDRLGTPLLTESVINPIRRIRLQRKTK